MHTLAEVLNNTQNGQDILKMALNLGFQNMRIFPSAEKNILCFIVDLDIKLRAEAADQAAENARILEIRIARKLDCVVRVLQNDLMSLEGRENAMLNSVLLPVNDTLSYSKLNALMGNPDQYEIKKIEDDKLYASNLEMFEALCTPPKRTCMRF